MHRFYLEVVASAQIPALLVRHLSIAFFQRVLECLGPTYIQWFLAELLVQPSNSAEKKYQVEEPAD
jgi:hypothetical protein